MNDNGWIKLHRKILDNPIVMKDSEYFQVWIYLLLKASHTDYPAIFKGEKIVLKPGQLITGRHKIAFDTGINESKVKRIIKTLKNEQQIDQQPSNQNSLISILNWEEYQNFDQQIDQQVTSKWTATDHKQEYKEGKEGKEDKGVNIATVIELYSELCPSYPQIKTLSDARKKAIKARLNQYSLNDFKTLFNKAEASAFLKGSNNRNWTATFDWLMKDANFAKVLDGNYDRERSAPKSPGFTKMENTRKYDFSDLEKQIRAN